MRNVIFWWLFFFLGDSWGNTFQGLGARPMPDLNRRAGRARLPVDGKEIIPLGFRVGGEGSSSWILDFLSSPAVALNTRISHICAHTRRNSAVCAEVHDHGKREEKKNKKGEK